MNIQDIQIVRGDTLELEVVITDENGNPIDIKGAKVFFTVKTNPNESDTEAVLQVVQQQHLMPQLGKTVITVSASQTAALNPHRTYLYDIQLVVNDKVYTVAMGNIKVMYDITLRTE